MCKVVQLFNNTQEKEKMSKDEMAYNNYVKFLKSLGVDVVEVDKDGKIINK